MPSGMRSVRETHLIQLLTSAVILKHFIDVAPWARIVKLNTADQQPIYFQTHTDSLSTH